MRGPQIACSTNSGLSVTFVTRLVIYFNLLRIDPEGGRKQRRVNDSDTAAKENLMALAADGDNAFAAWLDLRDKHNKILSARSIDGGQTWSKKLWSMLHLIQQYVNAANHAVAVKGNTITVMFRNWLNGNRDLYMVQS